MDKFVISEFSGYVESKSKAQSTGAYITEARNIESVIHKIPFYIAFAFGFLGSLIYTLRDTAYRFYTSDLYPRTLVSYIIRFIFASSLCLVIAYYLLDNWWVRGAPILFFLIGHFPQRAMQYVEEKAMSVLSLKKREKQEVPLEQIQGMTDYILYRLRELGIGDAQNLAFIDLDRLCKDMGYCDRILCDFVAQALLLVYAKNYFVSLQTSSIRDIIAFQKTITKANYENKAKALNIPSIIIEGILDVIEKSEDTKRRIAILEKIMTVSEKEDELANRKCGYQSHDKSLQDAKQGGNV